MRASLHFDRIIQRLLPFAALLGSPCCGTFDETRTFQGVRFSPDGGFVVSDGGGVVVVPDGGTPTLTQCDQLCRAASPAVEIVYGCTLNVPSPTYAELRCNALFTNCREGSGRRPAGLVDEGDALDEHTVGAHLAELARMEAASVRAFTALRDELALHDAPPRLVHAATRAAQDEVRHARQMARLARLHGSAPRRAVVRKVAPRALEEVALENAVEGCVHETWGAFVASWQARSARSPRLRSVLRGVARDESRHADLAWAVAAWAEPKLDREARARVTNSRRAALDRLRAVEREVPRHPALVHELGYPCSAHAATLVEAFSNEVSAAEASLTRS